MSYQKLLKYFFVFIIIAIIGLSIFQANKPIPINSPYLYLVQEQDSTHDILIRTKDGGNTKETVFSGRNIRGFTINGNQLLISEGEKYKTTNLKLVNLDNKEVKDINFENHYVDVIYKLKNDFIFVYEDVFENYRDYNGKIGILRTTTNTVDFVNPQSYATGVSQFFVNPSGTLAIFNGFNQFRFLLDLENYDNIKKIEKEFGYTSGFVDDKRILTAQYNYGEFRLMNVADESTELFYLEGKNFEQILSKNGNHFYTYKNTDIENEKTKLKFRKYGASTNSDGDLSYENLTLSPNGDALATAVYNKDENKAIQDVNQKEFITPAIQIMDIKKNVIFDTKLRSKMFSF